MSGLRLDGLSKRFGDRPVLDRLTLAVEEGEFFAVLGPSGCGKTTMLRIVAGFLPPDEGRVWFGARDVTELAPEKRDAAMVFQSYALFPHLDVGGNVAFGLAARGIAASAAGERVRHALSLVGLGGRERAAVGTLSGGEQQRVALARALVVEPPLLLLDEPMSNLDPKLREGTRADLRSLQRRLGITTLYVTHDQQDALEMADRLAVIESGRVVQVGTPQEVYDRPASPFVATFLGRANLLDADVVGRNQGTVQVRLAGRIIEIPAPPGAAPGDRVQLALRPESVRLGPSSLTHPPGSSALPAAGLVDLGEAEVRSVEFRGSILLVILELAPSVSVRALVLNDDSHRLAPGRKIRLGAAPDRIVPVKRDGSVQT